MMLVGGAALLVIRLFDSGVWMAELVKYIPNFENVSDRAVLIRDRVRIRRIDQDIVWWIPSGSG